MATERKRVLILCTGNSCRSQMAEGWVRRELGDRWEVRSAGVAPAGYVQPLAIEVMAEVGIDISEHEPEAVERYLGEAWDLVVTVCSDAEETCPVFPGEVGERLHMPFLDPSFLTGGREWRLTAFRRVRDDIRDRLLPAIAARA